MAIEQGSPSDEARRNFLLHEFDAIRSEIEQDIKEMHAVERYAIVGTAAIWTWLAPATNLPAIFRFAWWIPFLLVILTALRVYTIWQLTKLKGRYIKKQEEQLNVEGWEHFLDREEGCIIKYSPRLLWGILVPVTMVVPIWVFWNQ